MVFKIIWTPTALNSYLEIMDFLETSWTQKEVNTFAKTVDERIKLLKSFSRTGSPFGTKHRKLRKTLVHEHVQLYYRILPAAQHILLVIFWDTRRNPRKLKKFIKK